MKVRFEYQPLVRQEAAMFTVGSTEYQIMWSSDSASGRVWFGVAFDGGPWHTDRFGYADAWRERNDWPAWDRDTFRRMVNDFVDEGTD